MSPAQLKKLQHLSQVFSDGKATPQQIQQLASLLAQINCNTDDPLTVVGKATFDMPSDLANVV